MVDIGRAPYRTRARLYPDSDEEFEIQWYIARDDAPLFRGPRAVNNLEWEKDRDEYLPTSVGEIYSSRRSTRNWRVKLLALGQHQCGTAADFAGDGVFDPDSPPVEYRPDHLPKCCGWAFEGAGGGVGSGGANMTWTASPVGDTCCDAGAADVGVTYAGSITVVGIGGFQYYRYTLAAGSYTATTTWSGTTLALSTVATSGPTCDFQPDGVFNYHGGASQSFTLAISRVVCVSVSLNFADAVSAYTFEITSP